MHFDATKCGRRARSATKAIRSADPEAKIDSDPTLKRVIVASGPDEDTVATGLERAGYPARRSALPGAAAQ